MKINSIILFVGLAFISNTIPTMAAEGGPTFHSNFETARKVSKETGKPLITIFSATWCPPCQKMKRSVYPSSEVKPFHDSFVWAYLDADEKENTALMSQFNVNGIPHIAFVASDGQVMGHMTGAVASATFAKHLTQVLADHKGGTGSGTKAVPGGSGAKPQAGSTSKGSGSKK